MQTVFERNRCGKRQNSSASPFRIPESESRKRNKKLIFEAFQQAMEPRTANTEEPGLGLTISREIARLLGWKKLKSKAVRSREHLHAVPA